MHSAFGQLKANDFVRGAVTAVFAAVIMVVYGYIQQPDFNVFDASWGTILAQAFNAAIVSFVAYLGKNAVTDSDGKIFGAI
ncbi:MAG: hypothetical protein KBD16_00790 [Candidatus Pacebacteria bacterium]|nr:hypothetical protein [Candidatus Paceibacterota bacterium]